MLQLEKMLLGSLLRLLQLPRKRLSWLQRRLLQAQGCVQTRRQAAAQALAASQAAAAQALWPATGVQIAAAAAKHVPTLSFATLGLFAERWGGLAQVAPAGGVRGAAQL